MSNYWGECLWTAQPLPGQFSSCSKDLAQISNGEELPFDSFKKSPPNRVYYWTFNGSKWPEKIDVLTNDNFYGPYFAYLMQRHALTNVYITNLVKCRLKDGRKDPRIETECFNQYLNKELSFFMPALAFCFGDQATNGLQRHKQNAHLSVEIISLWHPRGSYLAGKVDK